MVTMGWLWWAVAAVLLLVAEGATATLAAAMAAVGALAAAGLGALGLPVYGQLGVFVAVSLGLIVFLRPALTRATGRGRGGLRFGPRALIGTDAVVTVRVDANQGRIRLVGEEWSARTIDSGASFEPGAVVHVAAIDGATALVV
jgi:membrane protein implicated in regulation of membrane protease activity